MEHGDRLAREVVLPPTAEGVLALGEQLVKVRDELDDAAVPVEDDGVMVLWRAVGYAELAA